MPLIQFITALQCFGSCSTQVLVGLFPDNHDTSGLWTKVELTSLVYYAAGCMVCDISQSQSSHCLSSCAKVVDRLTHSLTHFIDQVDSLVRCVDLIVEKLVSWPTGKSAFAWLHASPIPTNASVHSPFRKNMACALIGRCICLIGSDLTTNIVA